MKKLMLLSISLTALFALQAVSIHVSTPGTLSTLLTAAEKTTTTELTLTGNINASDVKCLREELTNLSILNLSAVIIEAYSGSGGTSTAYSYPANEMPANSFFNLNTGGKKTLTSVHLPNSITSIGESAFCNCNELTSISIPALVTSIGVNAFIWCTKMTEYFVKPGSQNFSTMDGVLYNLNQTTLVQYPNGKQGDCIIPGTVTSIAPTAFSACFGLSRFVLQGNNAAFSVADGVLFNKDATILIQYPTGKTGDYTVPNFVESIGYAAFDGCDGLTNVTVGNSVTNIAVSAFAVCRNLLSVTIGKLLATIGDNAFAFCGKQTAFVVDAENPFYSSSNGVLFNKNKSTIVLYPAGKQGAYEIPNSVTSIGNWAFYSSKISSVTIPNTVTSIGNSAFFYCKGLTSVTIPNSVTTIGDNAFGSSSNITNLNVPNSVTFIGNSAFSYCSGLTTINIPNTLTAIGNLTFEHCTNLSEINIPTSVKTIGDNAFRNCTKIISLTIPQSVTSIGSYAFWGCGALTSILAYPVTPVDLTTTTNVFDGVDKSNCTLFVPLGSKTVYQNAIQWMDFTNIIESLTGLLPLTLESISIYPSLVTTGFRIKGMEGTCMLKLMDLSGKLLITKFVTANEFVPVSEVASGIYILNITANEGSTNRKLIKY